LIGEWRVPTDEANSDPLVFRDGQVSICACDDDPDIEGQEFWVCGACGELVNGGENALRAKYLDQCKRSLSSPVDISAWADTGAFVAAPAGVTPAGVYQAWYANPDGKSYPVAVVGWLTQARRWGPEQRHTEYRVVPAVHPEAGFLETGERVVAVDQVEGSKLLYVLPYPAVPEGDG
jgi:hypothetical protein